MAITNKKGTGPEKLSVDFVSQETQETHAEKLETSIPTNSICSLFIFDLIKSY